jgi:hypothetical protein
LLVIAGGASAGARSASAEAGSLTPDDAWFASLSRAESLLSAATSRGVIDSADHAAVVEQIRNGVHVLGAVVCASIAADTVTAGPFATARPPEPLSRRWQHRVVAAAGGVSVVASLVHWLATLNDASPQTSRVLGYVGGSAAAVGGVLTRWMAREPSRSATETIERMRALGLETDLRVSVEETERAAEFLWEELRGMALDSCATDRQRVRLARRYAGALEEVTVIVDSRVSRSRANARSCAEYPGFAAESRERCEALASHLDALDALWQQWRWLFERSKRNTLDYLVLVDRSDP